MGIGGVCRRKGRIRDLGSVRVLFVCAHRYDSIDRVDKILILVIKKYRRLASAHENRDVQYLQDHNPHKPL
jgi:hypothetical protein